jgi:DDE superfamily endonuclease
VDCSLVRTSRPNGANEIQQSTHNGHKRCHGLNFQTVATPDGSNFHLFGPEEGRRHDSTLYRISDMNAVLAQSLVVNDLQLCLVAESDYTLHLWLQAMFLGTKNANDEIQAFKKAFSGARVAVEWSYKDIRQTWTSLDFKRKLNLNESHIGSLWILGCLLWNLKVVLGHGCQTREHFDSQPPIWSQ